MTGGHFVYMLMNSARTIYTGYATDVARRLAQHNGEKPGGAKFTRGRGPWRLVHAEEHASKSAAQKREAALKRDRKFKATLKSAAKPARPPRRATP
ncbi:MAG: GIY-YIG nuclease family protein [Magnetospirillum sp.]|jgi:putative endonuclease|nr:GIY-YIG nuclease family protein [Magnetospirillum sp.]